MTAYMLKLGIPLNKSESLLDFIKNMLNEFGEESLRSLTLSNTTASKIARECISTCFKEEVFDDIKDRPFSLSFDESSDKYGPTCLCTFVKYIKNGEIHNKLLSLNDIGESFTGEDLYDIIVNSVFKGKEEIIKKNLIGLCTDKGSNMISKKDKGLANRLKQDLNSVIVIHDFSHIFNLVSSYSIKRFPSEVISLVKDISAHFRRSSLRRARLKRIQSDIRETDFEPLYQVLSYTSTRWLSLLTASERIVALWTSLEIYFNEEGSKSICQHLNQDTLAFLELLVFLLKKLIFLIKYFEADCHDYSVIVPKIRENFYLWAQFIVKDENFKSRFTRSNFFLV